MICLRFLRRRRATKLSILWIVAVVSYFFVAPVFTPEWRATNRGSDFETLQIKGFAPFLPNETKSVVVLTYQRGGSTLFGNMFNTNPDIFYIFEPLDALYSDMYGTSRGWNVPSEITNYWNGSERNLPTHEIKEVSEFLQRIFQCKTKELPISFLVHPYYFLYSSEYRLLEEYINCIDGIENSLTICDEHKPEIENFCGSRFGEQSEERLLQCYNMLWRGDFNVKHASGKVRQAVFNYNACNRRLRKKVDDACTPMIHKTCSNNPVRAVKCVRATMDSMEPLLTQLPNFRVIHLMRDPRGVVLSRMKFHDSTRNRYSDSGNDTMVREAELYCRTVANDIKKRLELENAFPGKIFSVVYDHFVTNIKGYTEKIYQFLDLDLPNSTSNWVAEAMKGKEGKNATAIANAWQEQLTYKDGLLIAKRCAEFFKLSKQVTTL